MAYPSGARTTWRLRGRKVVTISRLVNPRSRLPATHSPRGVAPGGRGGGRPPPPRARGGLRRGGPQPLDEGLLVACGRQIGDDLLHHQRTVASPDDHHAGGPVVHFFQQQPFLPPP